MGGDFESIWLSFQDYFCFVERTFQYPLPLKRVGGREKDVIQTSEKIIVSVAVITSCPRSALGSSDPAEKKMAVAFSRFIWGPFPLDLPGTIGSEKLSAAKCAATQG